jgi:hypothetical protein
LNHGYTSEETASTASTADWFYAKRSNRALRAEKTRNADEFTSSADKKLPIRVTKGVEQLRRLFL